MKEITFIVQEADEGGFMQNQLETGFLRKEKLLMS